MQKENRAVMPLLLLFFFSSGFAALLYQVVWLKYLNLLFGSTTYATAAVLAAFMFGLSAGSRLSAGFPTLFRAPLRIYGLLEIGIGLFAVAFPVIYSHLQIPFSFLFNLLGPHTIWYNLLTFLIAFIVLAIPTSLMGATLPVLSHWVIKDQRIGDKSGTLYAINTAGAVTGILCSAFIFIPRLGLSTTVYIGVLINLTVGLVCFLAKPRISETEREEPLTASGDVLLYLYAFSGVLAIAYEVVWTRILVLHLGSSVYAYAIMLAVFLLGISLGSFVSGKMVPVDFCSRFGWIQILWAFSILLQTIQFSYFSDSLHWMVKPFSEITPSIQFLALFAGAATALLIPTFLSGALFPIVVTRLWKVGNKIKDAISLSYSYNTVGGILGSLIAGFVMIPWMGTQNTLLCLAVGNLILGLAALHYSPRAGWSLARPILIALSFFIALTWTARNNNILQSAGIFQMDKSEKLLHLEEDSSATISVEKRNYLGIPYDSLSVNGVNVAGTSPNLLAIQKLQAHFPMILYGPRLNKNVLHIGFGSGGTAYSVSLYPDTKITVVELSRGIVRNADSYFRSVNHGVVQSGKIRFIYFDGRSFLQNSKERFDIILSDSIHPRYSGNGSLYTRDYYRIVYDKLTDGGVHSQWIPLYSVSQKNMKEILAAFRDVFPETYVWYANSTINPYVVVTGKKNSSGISFVGIKEVFSIPDVRKDLGEIGIYDEYSLLDHFLFGPKGLLRYSEMSDVHTDDLLTVEYESSRVMDRNLSWWLNFQEQIRFRERVDDYLSHSDSWNRNKSEIFFRATTENIKGQLHFIRGRLDDSRSAFAEAARLNPADREPFEYYHIRF